MLLLQSIFFYVIFFSYNYTLAIMEFTDKCLPCVVHEFDTIFFIATLQTYKRHSIFHNENNICIYIILRIEPFLSS